MQNRYKLILFTLIFSNIFPFILQAQVTKTYNIGYFEAGQYEIHSLLRDEYFKQLEHLLPDSIQLFTIPDGYRSADWNRTTCKEMAKQLTDNDNIDIMIAVGPWVVQDLLEAGFTKPIIGMHQFNPKAEGLIETNDRPIAENLTVHFRPGKALDDLRVLTKLLPIKKLGVLNFPSDDTTQSLYNHIKSIGEQNGFKVYTAREYDNAGTFAFYKSYNKLKENRVDAIYFGPLWGLLPDDLPQFFEMVNRDKTPTFTDEGSILIKHGATATNNYFGVASEAYFNAYKTIEIIKGVTPADLPVIFRSQPYIGFNKQSAIQCNVKFRSDIFNSYEVLGEGVDEQITPSSLSELIYRGTNQNPQVLSHVDKLLVSDADIAIAKSSYKPHLYGHADLYYTDNNYRHNLHNSINDQIFTSTLQITQTLFSKEKLKEIQSAKKLKDIAKISKTAEQLDLELAISLAYLDYAKFQEQSKIISNFRSMLSYNLEVLYAKQIINKSDSLQYFRLDNERYSFTLAYIENNRLLESAKIILNSLLNISPDEKIILDNSYFSEDRFIESESPLISKLKIQISQNDIKRQLLDKMLVQSPNQKKSDALIAYHKSVLEKFSATYYPELKLHGTLKYDNYQKESVLFKEKRPSWYIGGKLTLPIYLGGKRSQQKKKTEAIISDAEYQKDETSLLTMQNGLTHYHRLLQYLEQMTPAYQSKIRANNSVEIANNRFINDNMTTSEYLDIIETGLQTNLLAISTRYNYYAYMSKIIHDLGIPVSDSFTDFVTEFHAVLEY